MHVDRQTLNAITKKTHRNRCVHCEIVGPLNPHLNTVDWRLSQNCCKLWCQRQKYEPKMSDELLSGLNDGILWRMRINQQYIQVHIVRNIRLSIGMSSSRFILFSSFVRQIQNWLGCRLRLVSHIQTERQPKLIGAHNDDGCVRQYSYSRYVLAHGSDKQNCVL